MRSNGQVRFIRVSSRMQMLAAGAAAAVTLIWLGTLLAVGLMMLPATAARFWVRGLWSMALVAFAIAFASGWLGLVVSFWFNLPSGPAIILAAGGFYLLSLGAGVRGGLLVRLRPGRHRAA